MESISFENIARTSLLYDFYGNLLTDKQKEVFELYHEENLSLSEIASELGISRQGVHEALKKSEKLLENYEEKLGLVARLARSRKAISGIDSLIDGAIFELSLIGNGTEQYEAVSSKLEEIKRIIDELEE